MHTDDLDTVTAHVAAILAPATGQDWSAVPGTGDWTARHTAEHLGDCLLSYAAQLVARPTDHYVRFEAFADKDATSAELLEFAVTGSRLLSAAVRTAPPETRAYHPTGLADPAGFAGMGCVEMLVHGHDLAAGLGLALDPPRAVCARVLTRMFPHTTAQLTGLDPWRVLLWATGRAGLPDQPRQSGWRWRGAPPE
ncbi:MULTISPECIES: maleylpyruvate isomerase N-terminal domain-containing protein [unclassified Crossiella]|uniref:maleylpyruvate isomerase N-terminal domain-containing protein n=1 Tax=unclassified Crossiella TaxID=2620835 RepID=UPI001FFF0486|nr:MULTISPECIES: maleylpyruvate isomerase N-terminal domain-containing protein [unclassified Crossiella]MCK2239161.1 maleylpyruvate isomerase N-terminal domain-containing protein [Crossiella sp. S99.2]MCK2251270.1 maleylpyruvate isomerase N-terminal domain-containing protein [Crossiella sp. S99.1]